MLKIGSLRVLSFQWSDFCQIIVAQNRIIAKLCLDLLIMANCFLDQPVLNSITRPRVGIFQFCNKWQLSNQMSNLHSVFETSDYFDFIEHATHELYYLLQLMLFSHYTTRIEQINGTKN